MKEKTKRAVIIGAAKIKNYKRIKTFLNGNDFYIFCDGGLNHQKKLNIKPDLIIGDFDSHKIPKTKTEKIILPCEKDDTDTIYAVKEAASRGFTDFLLLGVIGERLDHSFANLSILLKLAELNYSCLCIDDYSEIKVITSKRTEFIPDSYKYFSIINLDGTLKGLTIKNAKYPLEKKDINCNYQFGISNEVLPEKTAEITLESGSALLILIKK